MTKNVFLSVPCLSEKTNRTSGQEILKKWFKNADRRMAGQYLQKFIAYNEPLFNFLNVSPIITGSDNEIFLYFKTRENIGAIPLRSPDTGKQIGDLIVTPRYSTKDKLQEYIDISNLLEDELKPIYADSIPLLSKGLYKPPGYFEAVKFIKSLEIVLTRPWQKFNNISFKSTQPSGNINWNKHAINSYKVENRLNFDCSKSILSQNHSELSKLKYVYLKCRKMINSSSTPIRVKIENRRIISLLDEKLYHIKELASSYIEIKAADSKIVKDCKNKANIILSSTINSSSAWKINYADVFEKYVQYLFSKVTLGIGGKVLNNYRIKRDYFKYSWGLRYLEPDLIYSKNNNIIYIDAKYKSNLYNKQSDSSDLKDTHRHDLHQILAYSGFNTGENKFGILCYPSVKYEIEEINYFSHINSSKATIKIIGLPLNKDLVLNLIKELSIVLGTNQNTTT